MNLPNPKTNARRLAMAVAGLSATLLLIAGPAEARIVKISVGVSGTQSAHGHVVDHDAICADPTGDWSESYSIRTYRPGIQVVLQGFRGGLAFSEMHGLPPEILTRGTIRRTSTLTADGQVCGSASPASCGTRSFARLALSAVPAASSRGRFQGVGIQNSTNQPRDPFNACAGPSRILGSSLLAFPEVLSRYNNGRSAFRAPIPASFLESCRHGRMTRRLDGTVPDHVTGSQELTGATTIHLSVTVKNLGCLRGIA
jgi:hypothetical protein